MKKIIALTLALLLAAVFAFAETPVESQPEALTGIQGMLFEIAEDGSLLINTMENGEVQVLINEETYFEAIRDIAVGDYLYIDYNGQMTRSLPPQVTASVVRMYVLTGSITEHFAEENAVMLNTETHGEVYVTLPEEYAGQTIETETITVYFNGAMTMSIPAQINAGMIVPNHIHQGTVTEIGENYLIIGEGMESIQFNTPDGMIPEDMKVGDLISVVYNGITTRSLPPQATAMEIVQISR